MQEKRSWGEYKVIFHQQNPDGSETLVKHMIILPGCNVSYQYHLHRDEIWTIIQGEGELILEGVITKLQTGDTVKIPREAKHSIRATNELHFIEVQQGTPLIEEDIVRLAITWDEISELRS